MSTAGIIILVVVLLAVLFAAGWYLGGMARSRRLRNRFGPEYDRSLESADNRRAAERELTEREKRHAQLKLEPLSVAARARYTEEWAHLQERFVDEPVDALADADALVNSVMRERGYPAEGYDQQVADLSVEHGDMVEHYRHAHGVHDRAEGDTEDMRKALVNYRAVFRALVGPIETTEPRDVEVPTARGNTDGTVDGARVTS
jgi:hypothetical protein